MIDRKRKLQLQDGCFVSALRIIALWFDVIPVLFVQQKGLFCCWLATLPVTMGNLQSPPCQARLYHYVVCNPCNLSDSIRLKPTLQRCERIVPPHPVHELEE
eukprot:TRINITY_DN67858_c7_g2_i1.p2 TRINITY_DN67858_c7_g2~~TRINITY_DN67858_c7_g2_i1.p2  ORF type:complete len:102 (+),score=1.80 TRINITY_DN67858_c7_g2_i1:583-888(+)